MFVGCNVVVGPLGAVFARPLEAVCFGVCHGAAVFTGALAIASSARFFDDAALGVGFNAHILFLVEDALMFEGGSVEGRWNGRRGKGEETTTWEKGPTSQAACSYPVEP